MPIFCQDTVASNKKVKTILLGRVAQSAQSGERGSSIAKDLIDSKDPKHMLFCRETAFVAIYALFQGYYSHPLMVIQICLPHLQNRKAIGRTGKLSIEQKTYRKTRKAIDGTEKLSIDQNGYR